jgi:hypothetical protein
MTKRNLSMSTMMVASMDRSCMAHASGVRLEHCADAGDVGIGDFARHTA